MIVRCIQNEMLFVGALVKRPDLFVNYSQFYEKRHKYDFSHPVTKFFYDSFETCSILHFLADS